jgi:mannose-6-phosphate isomerase-like protein (cupin superfamily)
MDIRNIADAHEWFAVLQTSKGSQTAVMVLEPGRSSGELANEHPQSEQILLVLEGEVGAEIGGDKAALRKGDVVIVPRGAAHRFTNRGTARVLTFNVYTPPAY